MKKIFLLAAAALMAAACVNRSTLPVYLDPSKDIDLRVEDALSRLTVEEKVAMVHAQSKFSSPGVPRLGIPEVWCTDGPHGIRPEVLWDEWDQAGWTNDSCTAFPALSALAATWDRGLSRLYGDCIGQEARYREKDVLLGPGVNICRTPLNGRNFEYMGEDPYLAAQMVVPYIKGVQENGVAACVKHYAVNNQETRRTLTNSNVDDRTLYEIYLPAFEAAVKEGGAWAIMGSYNLYNGQYNCHNKVLLQDILKGEWGFDGVVISDWGGCRDDDEAILYGLDMEYGTWTDGLQGAASNGYDFYHLANPYLERIRDGRVGTDELDDKVRRILRLIFRTAMNNDKPFGTFNSPEHYAAARKIAAEGTVLLYNNGVLPLPEKPEGKILVLGENAIKKMVVGGGSSSLKTKYEASPLEAFRAVWGDDVVYERAYIGDISNSYNKVSSGQDLSDPRSAEELLADAIEAARYARYVIFVGGLNKSNHQDNESTDKLDIILPYGQAEVIEAIAEVAPDMVVVNISGSPVALPFEGKVGAIVQAWYGGSESGNAIADVISGKVNPSGKLPFTIPAALSDTPLQTERQYPGLAPEDGSPIWQEYYDEGVFVGYRWYDSRQIKPLYAFGYGLSYTTFEYSDLKVSRRGDSVKVRLRVRNSGERAGAEVVQVYVGAPEGGPERPLKELKGFDKVYLEPGESRTVEMTLDSRAFSYFDAPSHKWTVTPGTYSVLAGASSDDIRLSAEVKL